jgi:hypothetical protein
LSFSKLSLLVAILLGIGLFFYTNYRAATLSLTHDEGVIYQMISKHSAWKIFNYVIPQDHMVNSLMMKFSCMLFPDSEYTLRLPNLTGHLLYIIFSILLLLKLRNPHLLITGFILLNFNPYLLDFFSVARGYGLSVSIMMVSIYFGFDFLQSRKMRSLILAFLFAVISVLTVYTLLNYFVALSGIIILTMLIGAILVRFRPERKSLITNGIYLLVMAVSAGWIFLQLYIPLQRVQSEQFIYQAFSANFYGGTIRPIVFRSIYNSDPKTTVDIVSYGLVAAYILAFILMTWLAVRKNFSFAGRLLFYSFVLSVIVALSVYVQYELFNIRFVQNRTATFLVPLMMLTVIGLLEEGTLIRHLKVPALVLAYVFALLFVINTGKHANFKWYIDWQYDSSTREMMNDLIKDAGENPGKEIKMGIVWLHEPSINFYREAWKLDWLRKADRKGYTGDFDYYYVDNADSILRKDLFKDKMILKKYERSNTVLLKK